MNTFDLAEVRKFTAHLDARLNGCDNGEGMQCATLDAALLHYANLCCTFHEEIRKWGREVFAGRVAFDPDVETVWIEEGCQLYQRAMEMLRHGQNAEGPCYILNGPGQLQAALWNLYRLLKGWVTPKLAVGPSARQGFVGNHAAVEEARKRIAVLPPWPANWEPTDPHQKSLHRMLKIRS